LKDLRWHLDIENEEIFTRPNDIVEKPSDRIIAHFDKLLCDTSSIDSICRSNHSLTMLNVIPVINFSLSSMWSHDKSTRMYAHINLSENKTKVIHQKIFLFYFAGEFSLVPLQSMALSVFPTIMDQIQEHRLDPDFQRWIGRLEDTYSLAAIFRMLRFFPELCNVSSRTIAS
jgi:hypothetical protein